GGAGRMAPCPRWGARGRGRAQPGWLPGGARRLAPRRPRVRRPRDRARLLRRPGAPVHGGEPPLSRRRGGAHEPRRAPGHLQDPFAARASATAGTPAAIDPRGARRPQGPGGARAMVVVTLERTAAYVADGQPSGALRARPHAGGDRALRRATRHPAAARPLAFDANGGGSPTRASVLVRGPAARRPGMVRPRPSGRARRTVACDVGVARRAIRGASSSAPITATGTTG